MMIERKEKAFESVCRKLADYREVCYWAELQKDAP